jgi:dUTP pyrophosphatase
MKLKIKKFFSDVVLPRYSHLGDAGLDLISREAKEILPGERHVFYLGFALEFEPGYAAIVKDKGGMGVVNGLHTMGGVFDSGYRGEYNVCLVNLSGKPYKVEQGDKIAQLVIFKVAEVELEEAEELSDSSRGEGKFGSTGK